MSQRYEIIFLPTAEKSYLKLARSDRKLIQRFDQKLQELAAQPYPAEVVVIKRMERYDLCRSKVEQSWRILYAVVDSMVVVLIADVTSRARAYSNIDTLLSRVDLFLETLDMDNQD